MDYLAQTLSVFISLKEYFAAKISASAFIAAYSFFFGIDLSMVMFSLTMLMAFDFITGIISAYTSGEVIESRRAFRTALKFGIYCILVSAAHLTDMSVFGDLRLEEGVIAFLAVTELVSILENAGKMGYVIPRKLLNMLSELRDA